MAGDPSGRVPGFEQFEVLPRRFASSSLPPPPRYRPEILVPTASRGPERKTRTRSMLHAGVHHGNRGRRCAGRLAGDAGFATGSGVIRPPPPLPDLGDVLVEHR